MSDDTSFFHDYVPRSKRPKPPTPPPEPKETNPWLISAPTPVVEPAAAAKEGSTPPAKENNPWLISAPTPNPAPAQEAPAAPEPADPAPPAPKLIPLALAAFPAIPVNHVQPQPHGQLFITGLPVQVPNQQPFWFRNNAQNAVAVAPAQVGVAPAQVGVAPVQVGIAPVQVGVPPVRVSVAAQRGQAPPAPAPVAAGVPQVVGPLNAPNEYYCKELDGGFTIRTREQIATMTGDWALSRIGYPYFVRKW